MEGNRNEGTSEGQTHIWIALCDIIRGIAQIVSFFSLATLWLESPGEVSQSVCYEELECRR